MESAPKPDPQSKESTAAKSSVAFSYSDQDAAIEVARGIHNAGGNSCDTDQLAAQLKMEAKGGGFRLRINGAQTFGLVVYERGGRISLTPLGRQILDPSSERAARVESFFKVELYAKVFDEFKGSALPPQPAIERAIIKMGVGAKVADRARQALMRSAKQAGFLEQAADRFIRPIIKDSGAPPPADPADKVGNGGGGNGGGNGGGGGGGPNQHPLVQGLLVTLPQAGAAWTVMDRMNWLTMANAIFKAIYTRDAASGDQDVSITLGDPPKSHEPKSS